jgi:hypothetical protein
MYEKLSPSNIFHVNKLNRLEGVDWINLARDRDCWRAAVNAVMNLGLHNGGTFLLSLR